MENLKKLIRALAQADLTIKDAQRLMKTCYEEVPEIERKWRLSFRSPSLSARLLFHQTIRTDNPIRYWATIRITSWLSLKDRMTDTTAHIMCDAIEIERFISREYGFAQ